MSDYARHEHHDFVGATRLALRDAPLQAALVRLTDTLMTANRRGLAALTDSDQLRDHAKRIKEHTLAHLDQYLVQLEASVQKARRPRPLGQHRRRSPAGDPRYRPRARIAGEPSNRSR